MITLLAWMASVVSLTLTAVTLLLRFVYRRLRAAWRRRRTRPAYRTAVPVGPPGPVGVPLEVIDWLLFALAHTATPEQVNDLASSTAREAVWWPVLGMVRARIGQLATTAPEPALGSWCRQVVDLDHHQAAIQ